MMRRTIPGTAGLLAALLFATASALGEGPTLGEGPALGEGPEETLAALRFRSAGVGREGRLGSPPGFRLKLVFADRSGRYLAGVRVMFRKEVAGRGVFSTGPWLWVKGPPGRYEVEAQAGGASARKKVTLPERGRVTVVFRLK